jgi:hypothetical protein
MTKISVILLSANQFTIDPVIAPKTPTQTPPVEKEEDMVSECPFDHSKTHERHQQWGRRSLCGSIIPTTRALLQPRHMPRKAERSDLGARDSKRVRFANEAKIKVVQKLTWNEIRGDLRDPYGDDPDYGYIGVVRDHRLSQFAKKLTLRKYLFTWRHAAEMKRSKTVGSLKSDRQKNTLSIGATKRGDEAHESDVQTVDSDWAFEFEMPRDTQRVAGECESPLFCNMPDVARFLPLHAQ